MDLPILETAARFVPRDVPTPEDLLYDERAGIWLEAAFGLLDDVDGHIDVGVRRRERELLTKLGRYARAFRATNLLIVLGRELAESHERHYAPDDRDPDVPDWESEALRNLFWTGHLTATEIERLLAAGLPTGALARWRALNEIALRAEFIRMAGRDTARRYLKHDEMRGAEQDRLQYALAKRSGADRAPKALRRIWAELDEQIRERYKGQFRGDYGWAHAALLGLSDDYQQKFSGGERSRGPQLRDVSRVVENQFRPNEGSRGDANFAVHGSPLSVLDHRGPIAEPLKGPSTYGLAYAGIGMASDFAALVTVYVEQDVAQNAGSLIAMLKAVAVVVEDVWQVAWEDEEGNATHR